MAPRARGRRRLVRQRRDALRPGPPPVRDGRRPRRALPGRLHLRGARPDARLVLLPAGREHPALRRDGLPQRRLPRPDPRRRGPEDEQEQGQRHRALDRPRPPGRRRVPLVPAHRAEPVGLLPLQPGRGRRGDAALPADALEHPFVPRHLRGAARRLGARRRRRRGRAPPGRPLDPVAPRRDGARRSPTASRATTPPAPGGRSRASSTTSPTGTCARRGAASGAAAAPAATGPRRPPAPTPRRRSRRCTSAWRR